MFDNFNVNLRKNEGFPTSVPCIPIPEYCQSNATLILGLISRRPTSAKLYSRIINLMRQRNKVFSMEIEILIRFIFVNNLQLCYSKKSIYELLHIRHVSFHWTMMIHLALTIVTPCMRKRLSPSDEWEQSYFGCCWLKFFVLHWNVMYVILFG